MKKRTYYVLTALLILVLSDPALANRLQSAAGKSTSTIVSIGQVIAPFGIVLGGVLMAAGAGQFGKMILAAAAMGAVAIFGGPAFIDLLQSIFR
jgi:small-conductance mechanosensitive channel